MARMAAGVRKRSDGTLEKRFTVDGKRVSVYGATTKEILRKEAEARKHIEEGLHYVENSRITLDKYFEEWLKQKRKSVKSNSVRIYAQMYRKHISPALGNRKLSKLEKRECVKLQDELISRGLSPASVNYCMTVLKIILNDAVGDEIIIKSPAAKIRDIKEDQEEAGETIHRALSRNETDLFFDAAKDSYYYNLFRLLISSGMRLGEASALKWEDIDMQNNVIHINKTVTYTEDHKTTIGTPKSRKGKRDLPLAPEQKAILQNQKKQNMEYGSVIRFDGTIFLSPTGLTLKSIMINTEIKRILKGLDQAGTHIDKFTCHAFRDTYATRYIQSGGKPNTLKYLLGHESFSMTMDRYCHTEKEAMQEESKQINII